MQVAEYDWENGSRDKPDLFAGSTMDLEQNEKLPKEQQRIALVLAPGLTKFGTSHGGDYDQRLQLLKMEVTCRTIRRAQKASKGSSKKSWFGKLCGR